MCFKADYYIKIILYPVLYLVYYDNNYVRDENGYKVEQYHIPWEI